MAKYGINPTTGKARNPWKNKEDAKALGFNSTYDFRIKRPEVRNLSLPERAGKKPKATTKPGEMEQVAYDAAAKLGQPFLIEYIAAWKASHGVKDKSTESFLQNRRRFNELGEQVLRSGVYTPQSIGEARWMFNHNIPAPPSNGEAKPQAEVQQIQQELERINQDFAQEEQIYDEYQREAEDFEGILGGYTDEDVYSGGDNYDIYDVEEIPSAPEFDREDIDDWEYWWDYEEYERDEDEETMPAPLRYH